MMDQADAPAKQISSAPCLSRRGPSHSVPLAGGLPSFAPKGNPTELSLHGLGPAKELLEALAQHSADGVILRKVLTEAKHEIFEPLLFGASSKPYDSKF